MNNLDNIKKHTRIKKSVHINSIVSAYVKPLYKNRGFYDVRLIQDWHHIVGEKLANKTVIDRITYGNNTGTLHIKTVGAFATELSYQTEYIIQKVNAYVGFMAIGAIKIHHNLPIWYLEKSQKQVKSRTKQAVPRTDIPNIESITDENLKNSLRLIAGYVYTEQKSDS